MASDSCSSSQPQRRKSGKRKDRGCSNLDKCESSGSSEESRTVLASSNTISNHKLVCREEEPLNEIPKKKVKRKDRGCSNLDKCENSGSSEESQMALASSSTISNHKPVCREEDPLNEIPKKKVKRKKQESDNFNAIEDSGSLEVSQLRDAGLEDTSSIISACNEQASIDKAQPGELPKKKAKKKLKAPCFSFDIGELFSNNGKRPGGSKLSINDVKSVYLTVILGDESPLRPTWCVLQGWRQVLRTVLVLVGGVSGSDYATYNRCFDHLKSNFHQAVPVLGDGNETLVKSALHGYLTYHMSKKTRHLKLNSPASGGSSRHAYEYALTEAQMKANDFPVWSDALEKDGFASTRKGNMAAPAHEKSKLVALDCEMCETAGGRALARVSLVDDSMTVLYDKLVKPKDVITDYLTQYSGITAEMLRDVKTTLEDVQADLLKLIEADTLLLGHSLDFDLRSLKLHHDNVIDTSLLYVDNRGPGYKSALRVLVQTYLDRQIQSNENGHCSIEDARACMELVKKKIKGGVSYGNPRLEFESIFEAAARVGKKGTMVASPDLVRQHCFTSTHAVPCLTDADVASNASKMMEKSDVIFCCLQAYRDALKESDGKVSEETKQEMFVQLDSNVGQILNSAPSQTLVVVALTSGFLSAETVSMLRDREQRKSPEAKEAVKRARDGLCFIKITK